MADNAEYSYKKMTDDEKIAFEQSIKADCDRLMKFNSNQGQIKHKNTYKKANDDESKDISVEKSDKTESQLFEDEFKFNRIDEDRLEELANIYSEIKNENSKLAKDIRTLVWLMVIKSGDYFVKQSSVVDMHRKYPYDCSVDEMWSVFTKCFDDFNVNYQSKKKSSNKSIESNSNEKSEKKRNRFIAYFKSSLKNRFLKIYKKRENEIVIYKNNDGKKTYGTSISQDQNAESEKGNPLSIQIEDPNDRIGAYDTIDTKVYLFSNLITNIMEHLGTDKRKANKTKKRMYKAFYTGDTIFFAKCYGLGTFYRSMCRSQDKILNSCLDDFFNFVLSDDTPKSIQQVKYSKIKKYKELNSEVFVNKNPEESLLLYIPTEESNDKRFGFENLVYAAFSKTTGSNITGQIKKYDAFREKYFFRSEI